MIEVEGLSKIYGRGVAAVDDLSFTVAQGKVTGFLGPNGSGKTTTMRMILGLERCTAGTALVDGLPYWQHRQPMSVLGALLDARGAHPARTLREHYRALAAVGDISSRQVEQVLDMVGLEDVAGRRIGDFSLGMAQRLGLGAALLGNPGTVMLDEPVNGLDPDGVLWMRTLLRRLADQGRAVLVSSHLMSEVALTADHLIVIAGGRLLADESTPRFLQRAGSRGVLVRSPQVDQLRALLRTLYTELSEAQRAQSRVKAADGGGLIVHGITPSLLAQAALRSGVELHELTPLHETMEDVFMRMTAHAASAAPRE
ncbi:ATP-binding cassette domain-containing protein [Kineococcus rhizosphaerae]|uniref:ABC-2 type transport system ATP-binding protein n=1 Tax=Kineococcus rhizosphaerae TaxID=559628 RepID=A0A2T0QRA4_9ACTN|nr:ATP-binding cassette domain-containing protein [Kineococcus rhizosphaerae]PRY07257.1 ABC-2 type transport system ATP-binding protein [Kineococcus rhizosphaerae]